MAKKLPGKIRWLSTVFLFFAVVLLWTMNPADNRSNIPFTLLRALEVDMSTFIKPGITPDRFKLIKDSLDRIKDWKKARLAGFGSGHGNIFLGVRKIKECDSCGTVSDSRVEKGQFETRYFIEFPNFILSNDANFFIDKNKYFIEYVVWERGDKENKVGRTEIKKIPVRFHSSFQEYKKPATSLFVPVSRSLYNFLNVFLYIVFIPVLLFSFWIGLVLPIRTLFSIANGKPFTLQNIRNLKWIGWGLVILGIAPILFGLTSNLILGKLVPKEIYYPAWLALHDYKAVMIAGLIVLILANAFKSGYILKQEQDLTV